MEVRAIAKYVRVQPRKVRIVADEIRGKNAAYSASLLRYHSAKSAQALRKVLVSAMANAVENHGLDADTLKISTIMVDEGPRLKRIQARAMGRANRIVKKTSHITVIVEDAEAEVAVQPHGTKAKARPTFQVKGKKKPAAKAAKPKDEEEPIAAAPEEAPAAEEAVVEAAAEVEEPVAETPEPEEATPVTESEAPEEAGSAGQPESEPAADDSDTKEQES